VVGVPELTAAAPLFFELPARGKIQFALVLAEAFSMKAALGTDAVVAGEHLFAQVCRIGAQFPFVDADRAAEREPPAGDLPAAAAAGAAPTLDPTSGLDTTSAHTRSS
jgi:hypothetical protein